MKPFLTLFYLLFICTLLQAQHFEAGGMFGATQYMGDLAEKDIRLAHTRPSVGLFGRYQASDYVAITLRFQQGVIHGDDAKSGNPSREARNLSFRSNISVLSFTPELYFPGFNPFSKPFSPYIFSGISFYRFNPQAQLNGTWIDLQPLGTEGQGLEDNATKYALNRFAWLKYGVGLRYAINDLISVGAELTLNQTFFDYLDDVSGNYVDDDVLLENGGELAVQLGNRTGQPTAAGAPRGNPLENDWFGFFMFTFSYNFYPIK